MRHGREYWSEQVAGWRASGLSQAAYCKHEALVYGTMNYWTRKLTAAADEGADQKLVELKAASLESPKEVTQRAAIELVVLSGRYLLRLWPGVRSEQLREVMAVLEERQ